MKAAFRGRRLVLALGAVFLLTTGCSSRARFARSRLPPGMPGAHPEISDRYLLEIDEERVRLTKEYLRLHHPGLAASLPPEDTAEAISFEPRMIVVHYTAVPTLSGTMDSFRGPEIGEDREMIRRNGALNVGIQLVVDRDGSIYRLYPETVVARHVIGLNHVAIGIENVGNGDLGDRGAEAPLTEAQLEANVALIRDLVARHPSIRFLIGHQEYRDLERESHPAHQLFHEEIPEYRTGKVDPGDRFSRRLRRLLRRAPGLVGPQPR